MYREIKRNRYFSGEKGNFQSTDISIFYDNWVLPFDCQLTFLFKMLYDLPKRTNLSRIGHIENYTTLDCRQNVLYLSFYLSFYLNKNTVSYFFLYDVKFSNI